MEDYLGANYAPKRMVEEAEKFIETHREQPFLLYLPFIEPHVAMHPPRESVERFPAEWDSEIYRGGNGYLPHPRPRAAYAAMISDLDGYVGRVLAVLDRLELAGRTLVVFTSDNGTTHPGQGDPRFHIGGADPVFFGSTAGLRGYKGSVYEGGIRVPMIARWPGRIPAGAKNDTPCYFADWFPTLCDAVGLPCPEGLDGESFWPALTGRPGPGKTRPMVWVFPEYGGQVAVRIGDFKVVRQGLATKKPGDWEVYDLVKDPGETRSLAAERGDLVSQAVGILRREVSENAVFPLPIPEVNGRP